MDWDAADEMHDIRQDEAQDEDARRLLLEIFTGSAEEEDVE